ARQPGRRREPHPPTLGREPVGAAARARAQVHAQGLAGPVRIDADLDIDLIAAADRNPGRVRELLERSPRDAQPAVAVDARDHLGVGLRGRGREPTTLDVGRREARAWDLDLEVVSLTE